MAVSSLFRRLVEGVLADRTGPLVLREIHFRFWQILLQESKIKQRKSNNPENLAKVDLWTSLLLRRFSALLQRSVIDFG
jgi:hypothetical protein